jgi:hypothetical protein
MKLTGQLGVSIYRGNDRLLDPAVPASRFDALRLLHRVTAVPR